MTGPVPDPYSAERVTASDAPELLRLFNAAGVLAPADVHLAWRLTTLADEPDVLGRFGYLVIGSGDNAFTSIANYYAMVGLMVTVVAPPGSLARSLRAVAHRVLVLERPGVRQAADAEPVALSAGPWSAGLAS